MTSKDEVEVLMNDLLGFAKKMLVKYGEFHPFGGYLRPSGAVVQVGVAPSMEVGNSTLEMASLVQGMTRLVAKADAVASGVAVDVKLPFPDGRTGDAIEIFLEHKDGYCAEVFLRYELGAGDVLITDVTAQPGTPTIFSHVDEEQKRQPPISEE